MCSSRESHDLFHWRGRRHFRYAVQRAFMHVLPDTFGRYWCRVVGHKVIKGEYTKPLCMRCTTVQERRVGDKYRTTEVESGLHVVDLPIGKKRDVSV